MKTLDDIPIFIASILASAAMGAVAFFVLQPVISTYIQGGICFGAPSGWDIPALWSWIVNMALLLVIALSAVEMNNHYHLEPGTQGAPGAFFIYSTAALVPMTQHLNSAVLMALVMIICWSRFYSARKASNTAQQLFLGASLLSLCSTFNYAFLLLLIPLMISAGVLKLLNFKSIIATIFGIFAPYVALLGLSLVTPEMCRMPRLITPFSEMDILTQAFPALLIAGAGIFGGVMMLLREAISIRDVSSDQAALNQSINAWLISLLALIFLDYANFEVYLAAMNLCLGFRLAGLIGSPRFHAYGFLNLIIILLYAAIFLFQINLW